MNSFWTLIWSKPLALQLLHGKHAQLFWKIRKMKNCSHLIVGVHKSLKVSCQHYGVPVRVTCVCTLFLQLVPRQSAQINSVSSQHWSRPKHGHGLTRSSAFGSMELALDATELEAYAWWPVILYMFYLMSVVCDDYLLPAVDAISARFHIPDDVAGGESFCCLITTCA